MKERRLYAGWLLGICFFFGFLWFIWGFFFGARAQNFILEKYVPVDAQAVFYLHYRSDSDEWQKWRQILIGSLPAYADLFAQDFDFVFALKDKENYRFLLKIFEKSSSGQAFVAGMDLKSLTSWNFENGVYFWSVGTDWGESDLLEGNFRYGRQGSGYLYLANLWQSSFELKENELKFGTGGGNGSFGFFDEGGGVRSRGEEDEIGSGGGRSDSGLKFGKALVGALDLQSLGGVLVFLEKIGILSENWLQILALIAGEDKGKFADFFDSPVRFVWFKGKDAFPEIFLRFSLKKDQWRTGRALVGGFTLYFDEILQGLIEEMAFAVGGGRGNFVNKEVLIYKSEPIQHYVFNFSSLPDSLLEGFGSFFKFGGSSKLNLYYGFFDGGIFVATQKDFLEKGVLENFSELNKTESAIYFDAQELRVFLTRLGLKVDFMRHLGEISGFWSWNSGDSFERRDFNLKPAVSLLLK